MICSKNSTKVNCLFTSHKWHIKNFKLKWWCNVKVQQWNSFLLSFLWRSEDTTNWTKQLKHNWMQWSIIQQSCVVQVITIFVTVNMILFRSWFVLTIPVKTGSDGWQNEICYTRLHSIINLSCGSRSFTVSEIAQTLHEVSYLRYLRSHRKSNLFVASIVHTRHM